MDAGSERAAVVGFVRSAGLGTPEPANYGDGWTAIAQALSSSISVFIASGPLLASLRR